MGELRHLWLYFYTTVLCVYSLQAASFWFFKRRCLLEEIPTQQDFQVKKFTGTWFEVSRNHYQEEEIQSAIIRYDVTHDGKLRMQYGGKRGQRCIQPYSAISTLPTSENAHMTFASAEKLSGSFWIVSTDYENYALIYGCRKFQNRDDECPKGQEVVTVLGRSSRIDDILRVRLEQTIEKGLCVDREDLRDTVHEDICPPHPGSYDKMIGDEPAVEENQENVAEHDSKESDHDSPKDTCVYNDIPVASNFDVEKVGGIWYILATWREASENTRSGGVFDLVPREDGYIDTYFTGAHNGACGPTFYGVMTSTDVTGQYSVQNEFQDGPIKFTYFTEDLQYGVTYQCTGLNADGSCQKPTIDVYGRSTDFTEEVRVLLRSHVSSMCVGPEKFSEIAQDVTCELKHKKTDDVSCKVADVKAATNIEWEKHVGTWYTVAAYHGTAAPSLTWFVAKGENGENQNWMGYSMNEQCVEPALVPVSVNKEDGKIQVGGEKARAGKIIYTDNENIIVYYECTRVLEDGTCDPQHNRVHFNTRSRDTPKHVIRSLKVMLEKMCYKLTDIQAVSHKVPCEADKAKYVANPLHKDEPAQLPEVEKSGEHSESHESHESAEVEGDNLDFTDVKSKEDFDAGKFAGVWYHAYRLKWSHHKFESEVNLVRLQEDGSIKAWSRHYHDGRCSRTATHHYTQTKEHKGDWSFDTYGGLKVLYTCYDHAVLYICDHVERDGHCKKENLEVEVLSRTKEPLETEVVDKLIKVIETVGLHKDDFEAVDNTAICELTKSGCEFSDLPQQSNFNMEKMTGTWYVLAHLKEDVNVESAAIRFVKSEKGYTVNSKYSVAGSCKSKSVEFSIKAGTALLTSNSDEAVIKILYSDYEHALLYVCRHMGDNGKCDLDKESVHLIGRTFELDDRKIRTLSGVAFESCFTQGDFQWIRSKDLCEFDLPHCAIADLPKAEDFDVKKFLGTWYGLYRLRWQGAWSDGVLHYELLENGNLKVSGTNYKNGACGETKWFIAIPGKAKYEWREVVGANMAYVRILDASKDGHDHAVLYHCDEVLKDGSCNPKRTYIEVLSRKKEEPSAENLEHLRSVVRNACYEPGDFLKTFNKDVHCEVQKVQDYACDISSMPEAENFNKRKFSGYWYVVAKLKGSYIPSSSVLRYQIFDDGSFNMYLTGYRSRRGCVPTTTVSGKLEGPTFTVEYHGLTAKSKLVWTDYNYALTHSCHMVLEDGSCAPGFKRSVIIGRHPGRIPEDVIITMNGISDQPCNHRENFEYVGHDVECELHMPAVPSCKWENIKVTENFDSSKMEGQWFMRYRSDPKRTGKSFSTVVYNYMFNKDGSGQALAAFEAMGKCYDTRSYIYTTNTPGDFSVRLGRHSIQAKVLFLSDKYLINYLCLHMQEDGFCDPDNRYVAAFSRSLDDVPEEVLDKAGLIAQNICMEPGDFIPIKHSSAHPCPFPEAPVVPSCEFDELPLHKGCNIEQFTGTWYVVAKLKGSLVRPSAAIRLEKHDDKTYHVHYTGKKISGSCYHTQEAKFIATDTGCIFSLDYGHDIRGEMRVLYTDYWYAMVYECLQVQADGKCAPGSNAILVFSRDKNLPKGVIDKLVPVAEDACYKKEDFVPNKQSDECEIEREDPHLCKVRNIPVQDNLDLNRFAGTWYSHYKKPSLWDSVVFEYKKEEDGTMRTYYGGELNGRCVRPYRINLNPSKGRPAVMTKNLQDRYIDSRIVYTDYEYAVIYNCEQVLVDGSCKPGHLYIDVVSRSLDPIPEKARIRLKKAIRETCYEPGDFVETPHKVVCSARPVTCPISSMGEQKDLDMGKFTGHWNIILGLKNTDFIDSGAMNIVTEENGYTAHVVGKRTGTCLTRSTEITWSKGTGVLKFSDNTGLVKVLYTDYKYALVYICRKLHGDDACIPGFDVVYGISRTTSIDDSHIRSMVDAAAETCFSQENFQWIKETEQCEVPRKVCKIDDMQKAETFDVSKISGRWYGRYHLRGHGNWQDGVMEFKVMENGHIEVSTVGSLNGECLESSRFILEHGKTVYEWKLVMAGAPAYVRILDASDDGNNHMVIYECDHVLEDGSCDPDREFVDILSRNRDALGDEQISHLRKVVTAACFEPGDFEEVERHGDLECEITHPELPSCKFNELPSVPDFDRRKVSGTWYAVARLDGSNVLTKGKSRWQMHGDGTATVYLRLFRTRRGCQRTIAHECTFEDSSFVNNFHGTKIIAKIVWTNYDVLLMIDCSNVQEDGNCTPGYLRGLILSRTPGKISEEVIKQISGASDQACVQRENYEYIHVPGYCELEVPRADSCKVENIVPASNVNKDTLSGEWILRYSLRSKFTKNVNWFHTQYDFLEDGNIRARWSMEIDDHCRSGTGRIYQTDKAGHYIARYGHTVTDMTVLFVGEKYLITYLCDDKQEDGYCNPKETTMSVLSRTRDPIPKEVLDEAETLAHNMCFEFGDFVEVKADREEACPIPPVLHEIGCEFDELPLQKNFNIEKQTGTWYAVAKLKGHMAAQSEVMRMFKISDGKYGVVGTSLMPRGGCRHGITAEQYQSDPPGSNNVVKLGPSKAHIRVLYSDYEYTMVYECLDVAEDGHCQPEAEGISVFARQPHLPDDAIQRMIPVAEKACYTRHDFELIPRPVECELPIHNPAHCKIRDIHVQEEFDLERFSGTWYSRYKIPSEWDTVAYDFEPAVDGTLRLLARGSKDDHCTQTLSFHHRVSKGNSAVSYHTWEGNLAEMKVVYTDYNHAVLYTCAKVKEDGTCATGYLFVNVMSRNFDKIAPEDVEKLREAVRMTCFEPGDFVESVHNSHCPPQSDLGCPLADLPQQEDFDMDKFTGKWVVVARLRGTGSIDSGVLGITASKDGEYLAYVTGAKGGECTETKQMTLHPNHEGNQADIQVIYGQREGIIRVMFTDYNTALMYLCEGIQADGTCSPGGLKVLALGRSDVVTNNDLKIMGGVVKDTCFTPDQFEWVDRKVHCKLDIDLANRCKPMNIPTAESFETEDLMGTWYVRFVLRGRTHMDSAVFGLELLSSGNVRFSATAARSGTCIDSTVVNVLDHTDNNAVWYLGINRQGKPKGIVKVLYLDSNYAVFYECSVVNDEEFCDWDQAKITVVSKSKTDDISQDVLDKLKKIGRGACFEPGMFEALPQKASCTLTKPVEYSCAGENMPSVEDFNMEKLTGTWYGVARLKGSPIPNSAVLRISGNSDGTYKFRLRGARRGHCTGTTDFDVTLAADGLSEFYAFRGDVKHSMSRILYTDYEVGLVYSCTLLQKDRSCSPGHDTVTVYSRTPDKPSEDVIAKLAAAGQEACVKKEEFEPIDHKKSCPLQSEVPDQCLEANIKAEPEFDSRKFTGTWYTLFRLRDSGNMDFGIANISLVDEHHLLGEFAFSVNGECVSVDTMYHHTHKDSHSGEFNTNIGRFQASVKILATDYNYAILYECENVDANGLCSEGGKFVGVFGRKPEYPPEDVRTKLRRITRDVCLEPGDFVATPHTSECEIKIDKAKVQCKLSDLPSKKDHVYNKDTGTWYGVAKLRGSNFLNSHVERGVFDEEKQKYTFYFAGERARGGCTPTGHTEVPLQVLGEPSGTVTLTSGSHVGQWRVLYNDYKYALYYECSHMLADDTCAPGYETVTAYSRKREHIPENIIIKIFEKIPQHCFTREDFVWINQNEECSLEIDYPDCRVRTIPTVEHFDLDKVVGDWYSRYLLIAHAGFDSVGVRFEKTEHGLKGYYSAAKNGVCQRTMELEHDIPNHTRGVWHRIKEGRRVTTKVMWTDYNYIAVYTCDEVLQDDHCAPGKDYIDVLARHLDPIPVVVIEKLKKVLKTGCYEPGDFVESDHNLRCDERSCKVDGVITAEHLDMSQIYGTWQLLGRTTHLKRERGPTSMQLMKGPDGTTRISMARKHQYGCNTNQGAMMLQGDATFKFEHMGMPGVLKVLKVTDELLMIYECFGVEPVDGYCPVEHEEIQVWGHKHSEKSEERAALLREIASKTTCVSLQNSVHVEENTECEVPKSCHWDDFVGQESFDPRSVLGEWTLVGRSTGHVSTYSTGGIKFAYTRDRDGVYTLAGPLTEGGECSSHTGTITYVEPTVYKFEGMGKTTLGRFLYVDDHRHIILECRAELENGYCPKGHAVGYVFAKSHDVTEEGKELVLREMRERTHDCYDLSELEEATENECAVPDPEGKQSCAVEAIQEASIDPKDFEGAWYLIARSSNIDLQWDAGVLHSTVLDGGVFALKYTGLVSYDKDECLEVYTEEMHPIEGKKGQFDIVTQRLGGLKSTAKILYADDDHFIWYECQGNSFTSYGACEKDKEHVEVFSRRRKVNSVEKQKLSTVIKEKTCMDLGNFVMANHTKKCDLPGITNALDHGDKSCKVADYAAQEDFDPKKFSGVWYEIERTRYSSKNAWESGIAKYETKDGNYLGFSYAGTSSGKCHGPFKGYGKPIGDNHGDLLMYVGDEESYGSPWNVHFTYKVIYTDYKVAITYACMFWNDDGTCRIPGEQVDILSRSPDLDSESRSKLYDIIRERLCTDVYDLVEPAREENCHVLVGAVDCSTRPMCMMHCDLGFVKDSDDCDTCKCVEPENPVEGSGEEPKQNEQAEGHESGDGEVKHAEVVKESVENIPESEGEAVETSQEEGDGNNVEESESSENESEENEVQGDEHEVEEAAAAANAAENSVLDTFMNWFN